MGDFNAVLNEENWLHGTVLQEDKTRDFREFLNDTGMNELQTIGRDYIWTNNHTYSRIDMALVNAAWMNTMTTIIVQIMEPHFSNHSPLKICFIGQEGRGGKPFRFFN